MAVDVIEDGSMFTPGSPRVLFETRVFPGFIGSFYDVTSDGQRFVVITQIEETSPFATNRCLELDGGNKKMTLDRRHKTWALRNPLAAWRRWDGRGVSARD